MSFPLRTDPVKRLSDHMARVRALEENLPGVLDGLANPYLEAFLELGGPWGFDRFDEAGSELERDALFESEMFALHARRAFVKWFAWSIPTDEALAQVAGGGDVVEVGAGGGYWAGMLRARGVTVHAYDRAPHANHHVAHGWSPVAAGGPRMAAQHPDATLLLCWPPYATRMAEVTVERYWRAGGRRVAYIGEQGGCTGESPLLDRLDPIAGARLPQWPCIHDGLCIYDLPRR